VSLTASDGRRTVINLKTFFDRVVLINLQRRLDRLGAIKEQVRVKGWPFREFEVFNAIDGKKVPVSLGWSKGGGVYGCRQSHVGVLQSALMDGVDRLLVLEDDFVVKETFTEECEKFFTNVPDDWDQLMLGGQHIKSAFEVGDGIVRCKNTQRTHAYAVRGNMMRDLYSVGTPQFARHTLTI
jgi:hypothetical protein